MRILKLDGMDEGGAVHLRNGAAMRYSNFLRARSNETAKATARLGYRLLAASHYRHVFAAFRRSPKRDVPLARQTPSGKAKIRIGRERGF
jgi:hypothetical protein